MKKYFLIIIVLLLASFSLASQLYYVGLFGNNIIDSGNAQNPGNLLFPPDYVLMPSFPFPTHCPTAWNVINTFQSRGAFNCTIIDLASGYRFDFRNWVEFESFPIDQQGLLEAAIDFEIPDICFEQVGERGFTCDFEIRLYGRDVSPSGIEYFEEIGAYKKDSFDVPPSSARIYWKIHSTHLDQYENLLVAVKSGGRYPNPFIDIKIHLVEIATGQMV